VLSNGIDIISDNTGYADDHDGFCKAIESFDPEKFA
jgi:hypothetical protein